MDEKIIIEGKVDSAYKSKQVKIAIGIAALGLLDFILLRSTSGLVFTLMGLLYYGMQYVTSFSHEITITDKRVICKLARAGHYTFPLDSISSVSAGIGQTISIASSSGRIVVQHIENHEKIYNVLNNLLTERKKDSVMQRSNADELKKFKELLDSGVITQEEFDAKKKQLLGL